MKWFFVALVFIGGSAALLRGCGSASTMPVEATQKPQDAIIYVTPMQMTPSPTAAPTIAIPPTPSDELIAAEKQLMAAQDLLAASRMEADTEAQRQETARIMLTVTANVLAVEQEKTRQLEAQAEANRVMERIQQGIIADQQAAPERAKEMAQIEAWAQTLPLYFTVGAAVLLGVAVLIFYALQTAIARWRLRIAQEAGATLVIHDQEAPKKADPVRVRMTTRNGAASTTIRDIELPCKPREMDVVAAFVVDRNETTLPINKYQSRGMQQATIEGVREWFVNHGMAIVTDNGEVVVNDSGRQWLHDWRETAKVEPVEQGYSELTPIPGRE